MVTRRWERQYGQTVLQFRVQCVEYTCKTQGCKKHARIRNLWFDIAMIGETDIGKRKRIWTIDCGEDQEVGPFTSEAEAKEYLQAIFDNAIIEAADEITAEQSSREECN